MGGNHYFDEEFETQPRQEVDEDAVLAANAKLNTAARETGTFGFDDDTADSSINSAAKAVNNAANALNDAVTALNNAAGTAVSNASAGSAAGTAVSNAAAVTAAAGAAVAAAGNAAAAADPFEDATGNGAADEAEALDDPFGDKEDSAKSSAKAKSRDKAKDKAGEKKAKEKKAKDKEKTEKTAADKEAEKERKKKEKESKRYPHKKYLNLAVKEKSGVNPLVVIPIILVLFVGGLVFSKFMIIDRFAEVDRAEAEVAALQRTNDALTAYTAKYPEVEEEYQRYSTSWMTNEESGTVSRMDMLALIEKEFMRNYEVMSISTTGNVISLKVAGIDLDTMSDLVQILYAREDVSKVEVSSANNTEIVIERTEEEQEDGTTEEVETETVIPVVTVIITMQQVEEEEEAAQ